MKAPEGNQVESYNDIFPGDSEMAVRMRLFDWSKTDLGPVRNWPRSLRTAVRMMLTSRQPMWLGWGEQLTKLYNDAYKTIVGGKHPSALGQPAAIVWREIWKEIGPMLETAMGGIEGTYVEAQLLIMERNGYPEETYYTFSYSPVSSDEGGTGGIICANTDETQRVLSERRLHTLRELAAETTEARTVEEACQLSSQVLSRNLYDLPFTLLCILDADGKGTRLVRATGLDAEAGSDKVEAHQSASKLGSWLLSSVLDQKESFLLSGLSTRFGNFPGGPWPEPSHSAMVLPLAQPGQPKPVGFLVAGISPRRAMDDNYKGFLELVSGQVATAIGAARAYEVERQRADSLAELDRAKTIFFSNVSHEFRTPLTLILGPLQDVLSGVLDPKQREELDVMRRNALRLQRLVNTLLDFSRIEAGRIQAIYEPIDLGAFTAELAGSFRSAIERVGIQLIVDCPKLVEPTYIDPDMWEKIVLNLLSNALKFTFEGSITVSLRGEERRAELRVRDTGIGIAEAELPHLFERFRRICNAQARTHEGSGIGLALVQELTKLHGGNVRAESEIGRGTTFIVSIPTGSAHLPAERIRTEGRLISVGTSASTYVEEALRWVPEGPATGGQSLTVLDLDPLPKMNDRYWRTTTSARILLADDNTDMREYLKRILSQYWTVEAVSNGQTALNVARERVPDLVLTDVMMPGLDGFELLVALRTDPVTQRVPVVLLSARAGEESRIEGLEAGADDYLVKPFSSRELVAKVGSHLKIAAVRARAEGALRESEERFRHMADTAPVMIWMSGVDNWCFWFNKSWLDFTGRKIDEEMGNGWVEGIHPEDLDRCLETCTSAFQARQSYYLEFRMRRHDGEYLWLLGHGVPRYSADKEFLGYIGSCVDITGRKRAEGERERLLAAEREARKLADVAARAKDEFLATVSHELRSPLNAMLGWARLLSAGNLDPETVARGLSSIERNAKTQAQLIEDLLDVSRIISGKFRLRNEPLQPLPVIEAAIDSMRPAAEAKGVRLQVILDPDAGPVSGDADRLQQVVWNLLSNAVKFTPKGGRVQVRLVRVNSHIEIVVSDTGQGIARDFLPYVFDRFRQADGSNARAHGGLGLGLAIVRHITELHGGSVMADSPGKDQGASFTVKLPLLVIHTKSSQDGGVHPRVDHEERLGFVPSRSLRGVRILAVDDEPDTLLLLGTVLTQCGAEVNTAGSAQEGFTKLMTWKPDVIVSDIGMPGEDGYAFMQRVKKWARETATWTEHLFERRHFIFSFAGGTTYEALRSLRLKEVIPCR